jgi:hypothetical protein
MGLTDLKKGEFWPKKAKNMQKMPKMLSKSPFYWLFAGDCYLHYSIVQKVHASLNDDSAKSNCLKIRSKAIKSKSVQKGRKNAKNGQNYLKKGH